MKNEWEIKELEQEAEKYRAQGDLESLEIVERMLSDLWQEVPLELA